MTGADVGDSPYYAALIAVVVLLFGAKRLPDMAHALGQSARIFKKRD
jgi:TatA/E family protein of Tat protein translocase